MAMETRLIKIGKHLVLTIGDETYVNSECTNEFYNKVLDNLKDKDSLVKLFHPEYADKKDFLENVNKSKILTIVGNSIYIKSISELTVPEDFAIKVLNAELNNDEDALTAYLNFWTLLSLNPDSRVRANIFWFIRKWDIHITKSGLLICYRNADIKNEGVKFNQELTSFVTRKYWEKRNSSLDTPEGYIVISKNGDYFVTGDYYIMEDDDCYIGELIDLYQTLTNNTDDETTTYTDHHSHSFNIKLGHVVTMPREEVDSCQENECSRGLSVAQ